MNFFKRRKFLRKANLLDLTPIRQHQYEVEENGRVILLVQKFKNKEIGKFMLGNRSAQFRIRLDEMGSAVWTIIDGRSNASELISKLKENWQTTPEKANHIEERFASFMSQLYDNRYITFKEITELK